MRDQPDSTCLALVIARPPIATLLSAARPSSTMRARNAARTGRASSVARGPSARTHSPRKLQFVEEGVGDVERMHIEIYRLSK